MTTVAARRAREGFNEPDRRNGFQGPAGNSLLAGAARGAAYLRRLRAARPEPTLIAGGMMTVTSQPQPTVDCGHLEPMLVHYDDLDSMGIVHNTRYAVLVERALHSYWTRLGYTFTNGVFTQPDACLAVAEFSITYRTPVRGTNEINVHFWIDKLGESSAVYAFRVLSADGATVHAEGRRVHIRLDEKTFRPTAWTPPCRVLLETLLAK